VAILKTKMPTGPSNRIADITGKFKEDPDFYEIVRSGKEIPGGE